MSYSDRHIWRSALQTLNGATDLDTTVGFVATQPVRIHRIGLQALDTAAGGASVVFEDRINTSTDATIETVVIPAANSIGTLFYTDLATPYVLEAGHRINLAVTEAGTAPVAVAVIEYSLEDRADSALGDEMVESA